MYGKFISRNIYNMLLHLFIQKHVEANYIIFWTVTHLRTKKIKSIAQCCELQKDSTVELQWLEHLRDYGNIFETGAVRANECLSQHQVGGTIGIPFRFSFT